MAAGRLRVWDLPTRLFHWTLAALMVFSVTTAKIGGNAMHWHFLSGYAILTLIVFRLLWGFAGDRYALFAQFVRGPNAVLNYLRRGGEPAGHNPLAAWSVLALLAATALQGATGLFANDAIFTEGPLAKLVSGRTSEILTAVHEVNQNVLYALVALHVAAIVYYLIRKRRNLVQPMIDGDQTVDGLPAADDGTMRLRALVLFGLAAALVSYIVNL